MSFTGDTKKLQELVRGVRSLDRRSWQPRLMRELAAEAVTLVQECFETSKDPYGTPWPKLRTRAGMPLMDTGRLRASITRHHSGSYGFVVGTNVHYARIHNDGGVVTPKRAAVLRFRVGKRWISKKSVTIPKRQFFPSSGRTPPAWAAAFREIAEEAVSRALRGSSP